MILGFDDLIKENSSPQSLQKQILSRVPHGQEFSGAGTPVTKQVNSQQKARYFRVIAVKLAHAISAPQKISICHSVEALAAAMKCSVHAQYMVQFLWLPHGLSVVPWSSAPSQCRSVFRHHCHCLVNF